MSFESWSRKVKVKALSTICTRYGYNFTLPRVSFSLCPLPPTLLSSLSPFLLLFPPVIFPFFFFSFSSFFFSYFFVLSFSFSREGWDLSKQIGGSYIPCCSTGPELLLLLFVVFYLRCTLWSISSGTLEWQGYLAGIPRVIFFYSSPRASFEDGWGGRGMTVKWRSNFGREN